MNDDEQITLKGYVKRRDLSEGSIFIGSSLVYYITQVVGVGENVLEVKGVNLNIPISFNFSNEELIQLASVLVRDAINKISIPLSTIVTRVVVGSNLGS